MIVQRLYLPTKATIEEEDMYIRYNRTNVRLLTEENKIICEGGYDRLAFDTYYNMFSIKKWKKYTILDDIKLSLWIEGDARIVLSKFKLDGDDLCEYILSSHIVSSETMKEFIFDYPSFTDEDALAFYIYPLSQKLTIDTRCGYVSNINEKNLPDVNLSLAICTYKREPFITRNMEMLNQQVFNNDESVLHDHLRVYISDNGNTLDKYHLETENIKIYPNKNSGGAGGFTRAAIEAINDKNYNTTNIIFMDDDIHFEGNSLARNYVLLKLLKPEFRTCLIGGAFLRLDHPMIQQVR